MKFFEIKKAMKKSEFQYDRGIFCIQGSEKSRFKDGCSLFNAAQSEASKFTRNDAERLFRFLILRNVIQEQLVTGKHANVIAYVKLGAKAVDLNNGKMKVKLSIL